MGLPSLNITFKTTAKESISKSDKGTVAVIIRDTGVSAGAYSLTRETQIPAELAETNLQYVKRAFIGNVTPPKKVLVYVTGTEAGGYADALGYLASQTFDYLAGPPDITPEEVLQTVSWIKEQREDEKAIAKVVLPDAAADDVGIINFTTKGIQVGDVYYSNAEYCSRIAGLIAGTPMRLSCTSAVLSEVSDVERRTYAEMEAAIDGGEFIIWNDGAKVKVGRGVNSLQTLKENQNDSCKKIKIIEALDMIQSDLRLQCQDIYIGRYVNNYDNKCLLISAITEYLEALADDDILNRSAIYVGINLDAQEAYLKKLGVETSEMTDQALREADTREQVFLEATVSLYDAIEDIDLVLNF